MLHLQMLHLTPRTTSHGVVPAPAAAPTPADTFAAEVATAVAQATAHHLWTGPRLTAAVHCIHLRVPKPRPVRSRREAAYFEVSLMSREMDHL
jgi:hypothetical protein